MKQPFHWSTKMKIYRILERLFIHLAHKTLLTITPFSIIVTFCKLGLNMRFVARIEKLRLCPNVVVLPHFSHFAICLSFLIIKLNLVNNKKLVYHNP